MKIVHFIHHDGEGGGPYSVRKQMAFYSLFHVVHVVHGGSGRIADLCEEVGIAHTRLDVETVTDTILNLPLLVFLFRTLKPDLLILHGQWAGSLGSLAGITARVPKMLYIAHWPAFYTDWDLKRIVRNWISEWLPCRLCDSVITLSRMSHNSYLQQFPWIRDKIHLLSNSIEDGETPSRRQIETIQKLHQWTPDKTQIVSVGRLVDQKRLEWLLDAWAECSEIWDRAHLWIIGEGSERQNLEEKAHKLGIEDSCSFLGAKPRGIEYIGASDIVVFTSLYEAFGNVALEAMLCGKPIIASRVAGIESTIEDGKQGFLVLPGDKSELKARILQLVPDRNLRERMGSSGRERVRKYKASMVIPRYLEIVNQLFKQS